MAKLSMRKKHDIAIIRKANRLMRDILGEQGTSSSAFRAFQNTVDTVHSASRSKFSFKGKKGKDRAQIVKAASLFIKQNKLKVQKPRKSTIKSKTVPTKNSAQKNQTKQTPEKRTTKPKELTEQEKIIMEANKRLNELRSRDISSPALSILEKKFNRLGLDIENGFDITGLRGKAKTQVVNMARAFINAKTSTLEGVEDWKRNAVNGTMKRFGIDEEQAAQLDDMVQYLKGILKDVSDPSEGYLVQAIQMAGNELSEASSSNLSNEQIINIMKTVGTYNDSLTVDQMMNLARWWIANAKYGNEWSAQHLPNDTDILAIIGSTDNPANY